MPADIATRLKAASTPIPTSFFSTLITANHVLHLRGIVDGYGHISARSPQNPSTFYLSASLAPALVSSRASLLEYHVSDGSPVDAAAPNGYLERFIHSEIYKRYPDVQAVVHAHSEAVIPFSVTSVPLRPVFHMGAVMGTGSTGNVPVYDIAQHYGGGADVRHDLLVSSPALGASLAAGFSPTGFLAKTGGMLKSFIGSAAGTGAGKEEAGPAYPSHGVVLMRGHGFTAVGTAIEEVVYRSVYTVVNARIQRDAVLMQGAWNTGVVGERVLRVGKEGYGGGDKEGSTRLEAVRFLSEREGKDAWESNKGQASRPWKLWVEEVKQSGLYRNEYWEAEEGKEGEADEGGK